MANSIVLQSTDTKKVYYFTQSSIMLGRTPDCDISFPLAVISRCHAKLLFRDGNLYLIDCGSANGTWLNGVRLEPNTEYALKAGDEIILARKQTLLVSEVCITNDFIDPSQEIQTADLNQIDFCRCESASDYGAPVPISWPDMHETYASADACMPSCAPGMSAPSMSEEACMRPSMSRMPAPPAPMEMPMPSCMPEPMDCCMQPSASRMPEPPAAMMRPSAPPAPKKKGGFLQKLFGKKEKASAEPVNSTIDAPAAGPVTADDVQFRGTAPSTILPGEYFPVKIMMYREDDYERADRESATVADKVKSASSSVFQAQRNQQFRIALQSPDLELDCDSQLLQWNGKFAAADFEIYLPEEYSKRQLRLRGRVYSGDAVLTDLKLILQIGEAQYGSIPCEKVRMRSAFISYASADRAKVVARIQGIQLACPDMDLFFDVESLRRGERWEDRLYKEISGRDLFYLFWSQNAANSVWVRRELEYAVSQKTTDYIEPIPLEGPEICPPPQSLMDKHFNDWTLRYIGNQ